jgi:2-phospho-L-lactate/phosphoenolpyruvate guanylyltransferase
MTLWRVLVPIKQGDNGKSRLAAVLSHDERSDLSLDMAQHVLAELAKCSPIAATDILSPERPDWSPGAWVKDEGRGLNAEITAWRAQCGTDPVLVIHADLPLVTSDDIDHLLKIAAMEGIALATDRLGEGSNALAIADGRAFTFMFGPDSRRLHAAQSPAMPVIQTAGLSIDVDTPEDLHDARVQGMSLLLRF